MLTPINDNYSNDCNKESNQSRNLTSNTQALATRFAISKIAEGNQKIKLQKINGIYILFCNRVISVIFIFNNVCLIMESLNVQALTLFHSVDT